MEQALIRLEWDIHACQEYVFLHHLLPRGYRASEGTAHRRSFGQVTVNLRSEIAAPHFGHLAGDSTRQILCDIAGTGPEG